jgi:diadenosine tetraphosphate (Ap4A) HIT family hydrolase
LDNARKDDQRDVMREIIAAGECPFCAENLRKYHKQPIVRETEHWLLTPNQWPYNHTKIHLLAIYKTHAERLSELTLEAGADLLALMQWAEKEYNVPGGGWAMRFGDTDHSAGTVLHIHAQFLVPDLESPGYEPVRIKIGKRKSL